GAVPAGAVAVGEEALTQASQHRMLGGIVNLNAQLTGATVQIQGAGFEDGATIRRIKVGQVEEVVEESLQVQAVTQQGFYLCQAFDFRLDRQVFRNQGEQLVFSLTVKQRLKLSHFQMGDGLASFFIQPGLVVVKACF